MTHFRAKAVNDQGLSFAFHFKAANWNGIEEVAQAELDKIVASDSLHQKHGPWTPSNIDVGY